MNGEYQCLRCGAELQHIMTDQLQLGKTSWLLGGLPNLLSGALEVDIFRCPECGHLEFFSTDSAAEANSIPQRKCPECGRLHDFDFPKCPYCKHDYN